MDVRKVSMMLAAGSVAVLIPWVIAFSAAPAATALGKGRLGSTTAVEQTPPEIQLEGRESVKAMERFAPFLGEWTRVESPPGTPVESRTGGVFWRTFLQGIAVESEMGPWNDQTQPLQIFWHPIERQYLFRKYEARNPADLLFEGRYEFLDERTLRRVYTGFYGDGRMERYRETFTILPDGRMSAQTEMLRRGEWEQLFAGSIYQRREEAER